MEGLIGIELSPGENSQKKLQTSKNKEEERTRIVKVNAYPGFVVAQEIGQQCRQTDSDLDARHSDNCVGKRQSFAVVGRNLRLDADFVVNVHARVLSGAKILNSRVVTLKAALSPSKPVSTGLATARIPRTS